MNEKFTDYQQKPFTRRSKLHSTCSQTPYGIKWVWGSVMNFFRHLEQKCFSSFVSSTFQESKDPVENCNGNVFFPGKRVET